MPRFVSYDGVHYPAKEHVVLPHLSGTDKEVYDGPDRAAMELLAETYGVDENGYPKQTTFGTHFKEDPMLMDLARQLGYKDVMEYAVSRGYNPAKAKENFEKNAAVIQTHKETERQPERFIQGGGISTAPGNETIIGGFGDEKVKTASDLDKENAHLATKQKSAFGSVPDIK